VAQQTLKKPNRSEREAERRKTILRAAVEVFSRKGYLGCRIADVAREAGVAYGLVYHYFKDKDELLESVFTSGWTGFMSRVQAEFERDSHIETRIKAIVQVAFEAYRRDPRGVKVLILEVGRSPAGGAVNRGSAFTQVIHLAAQMFRDAQKRGEVPTHLEPMLASTMLFGAIEMGLTTFVLGLLDRKDELVVERAKEQVTQTILRGLLSPPPEAAWNEKSATKSKPARRD
jgi:TetR/AcrR family fatty acid metabolism transcriptional regulator